MSYQYEFGLSDFLNSKVDPATLQKEIIENSSILQPLIGIITEEEANSVVILFEGSLTSSEEEALDVVVSTHEGISNNPVDIIDGRQFINVGEGPGELYKDADESEVFLRTIKAKDSSVTIKTVGDVIEIRSNAGAGQNGIEIFFPASGYFRHGYGNYNPTQINKNGCINFTFRVPSNFSALESIKLLFTSQVNLQVNDDYFDMDSSYGGIGESIYNHGSSTNIYLEGSKNVHLEADISSLFSLLSAEDICGLKIKNRTGGKVVFSGILLTYNS